MGRRDALRYYEDIEVGSTRSVGSVGVRIALLTLVLSSVIACGSGDEGAVAGTTTSAAAARPHIALVMKSLANEFFVTMAAGATAHQAQDERRRERQ